MKVGEVHGAGFLALSQRDSISQYLREPGFFLNPKLTDLYNETRMSP